MLILVDADTVVLVLRDSGLLCFVKANGCSRLAAVDVIADVVTVEVVGCCLQGTGDIFAIFFGGSAELPGLPEA